MKMFRHREHYRETEDNVGQAFPDCAVCGAKWFPMWPPVMERKHTPECSYAQDNFHAEGCASGPGHTGPCVVPRGPEVNA